MSSRLQKRDDLIEARKALGLSQDELAHAAGVSTRTISRMEVGHPVDRQSAAKIAEALGLTPAFILFGAESGERAVLGWPAFRERVRRAMALEEIDDELEERIRFVYEKYRRVG